MTLGLAHSKKRMTSAVRAGASIRAAACRGSLLRPALVSSLSATASTTTMASILRTTRTFRPVSRVLRVPPAAPTALATYVPGLRRGIVAASQDVRARLESSCIYTDVETQLRKTGLFDYHVQNEAKMVPFAGYTMPLQYGTVGAGSCSAYLVYPNH
jgi:hypothetical protein